MKKDPAVLKKVSINLPFGIGGSEWETDTTQRRAAWSLYVELVTRISVEPPIVTRFGLKPLSILLLD